MQKTQSSETSPQTPPTPKEGRSRVWGWLRDIALFALIFTAVSLWQEQGLVADGPAPDFELTSLEGETVTLADLQGKAVQLHFWATWCGVCKQEFGTLADAFEGLDDGETLVTIVSQSGEREEVQAFAESQGIAYPVLLGDRDTLKRYGVRSFPTNIYIDGEGEVVAKDVGLTTRWSMDFRRWRASL